MLNERLTDAVLCTMFKKRVQETINPLLKQVGELVSATVKDIGRDQITAAEELQVKSWLLQLVREMTDIIVQEQEDKVNKLIKQLEEKKKTD